MKDGIKQGRKSEEQRFTAGGGCATFLKPQDYFDLSPLT
jgi:hypothetical protein